MLVFFLYHLNLLQGSGLVLFLHLSEGKQSQINLPSMVWLHAFEAKQYHFFYLFLPGPTFSSLGHYHGPLQNSPLFCFISLHLWSNRLDDGSAPNKLRFNRLSSSVPPLPQKLPTVTPHSPPGNWRVPFFEFLWCQWLLISCHSNIVAPPSSLLNPELGLLILLTRSPEESRQSGTFGKVPNCNC